MLLCFGGPGPSPIIAFLAKLTRKPVYVIWAGSDVTELKKRPHQVPALQLCDYHHVAVADWLAAELAEIGISASVAHVAGIEEVVEPPSLPASFSVLTYLPAPRREFYGSKRIYELARTFPDIRFDVVGDGDPDPDAPVNVVFRGYSEDIEAKIEAASVLIRTPEHDGHSLMVNEALARGRHVIWIHDVPGVHVVRTFEDCRRFIAELRKAHDSGDLRLNTAGMTYIRENFTSKRVAASIDTLLEMPKPAKPSQRPKRVAVSGLPYFAGRICQIVRERQGDQWEAIFLDSSSRTQLLLSMFSLARSHVWYTIGGPLPESWLSRVARLLGKPRIMHWVGTDIGVAANNPALARRMRAPNVMHLAEAEWTARNLQQIGIEASIAPLPVDIARTAIAPLPERVTILLYLPQTRQSFYGKEKYERLISALAGEPIDFLVVGGGRLDVPPDAEVEHLAWRADLTDVYNRSTALVRFTKHDGLSLMVMEALAAGRYVYWTQPFNHVTLLSDEASLERHLRELIARQRRGELTCNVAGAEFIRTRYSVDASLDRIETRWSLAARNDAARTTP